jgi:hypothetical protein
VACTGDKNFYHMTRVQTANLKNVEVTFFELEGNYGIGKGRKHAAENYNNEDYFLEIDAHTYFQENWDKILIQTLEEAIIFSKNPKTIITSYLPNYTKKDNEYTIQDIKMPFMQWVRNETISSINLDTNIKYDTKIPKWATIDSFNDKIDKWPLVEEITKNKKFVDSIKVCGQFIFGNNHFAEGTRLDEKALFWEEEILQSIELLNDGFSILYPNINSTLNHYSQEQSSTTSRITFYQLCRHIGTTPGDYLNKMRIVYENYIFDPENKDKIEKFKDYAGIDLKLGTVISTTINKDI